MEGAVLTSLDHHILIIGVVHVEDTNERGDLSLLVVVDYSTIVLIANNVVAVCLVIRDVVDLEGEAVVLLLGGEYISADPFV